MAKAKSTKKAKEMPCGDMPCGSPKDWEKMGKDWEAWGESFGKHMEAKFAHGPPWHAHKKGLSVGGLVIGLLILAWGITWLGNDLKWWTIDFPFWPVLIIIVAIAILISAIKKAF